MDLHTSTLRDAAPNLSDISLRHDSEEMPATRSDPTLVSFVVSEVGGVVSAAFNGYSSVFINNLFAAVIFAFACNYLWELPLSQVVDVSLAYFLFVTGIMIGIHVLFMGRMLGNGEIYLSLYFAVIAILSGLLPFASIIGFSLYGLFVDGDWTASSTVYQWYVGVFGSGYEWLQARVGDVLGLMVVETDANGIELTKVNTEVMVQWAQISVAAVAILDFVMKRVARTA